MQRQIKVCLAVLGLALAGFGTGCGNDLPSTCNSPGFQELEVTLAPDSALAGTEATVVDSFERAVFSDGEFFVNSEDVVVKDAATGEWIGTFDNSRFRESEGDPPRVTGVVLSGEVIDDRSIELTLEFPNTLPNGAVIEMGAGNDDPHCSASVSGEAPLTVDFIQ